MPKQKKQTRAWGYNIITETDTDFKERWARNYTEDYLKAIKTATENWRHRVDIKWGWRELEPKEIYRELKLKRSEEITTKNDRDKTTAI